MNKKTNQIGFACIIETVLKALFANHIYKEKRVMNIIFFLTDIKLVELMSLRIFVRSFIISHIVQTKK